MRRKPLTHAQRHDISEAARAFKIHVGQTVLGLLWSRDWSIARLAKECGWTIEKAASLIDGTGDNCMNDLADAGLVLGLAAHIGLTAVGDKRKGKA